MPLCTKINTTTVSDEGVDGVIVRVEGTHVVDHPVPPVRCSAFQPDSLAVVSHTLLRENRDLRANGMWAKLLKRRHDYYVKNNVSYHGMNDPTLQFGVSRITQQTATR